jgi:3-deoxy-D-manno-octulosonate 8-phosphate phosphatase (KDO 8-P phosphatase)
VFGLTITPVLTDKLKALRALIMDVDGVLTDGRILIDSRGSETKAFDVRDGHGLKLLQRGGLVPVLLTGRYSQIVKQRAAELGITLVHQRSHDKLASYQLIKRQLQLADHEFAYIGDDLIDIPVLKRGGFSATVADAVAEVAEMADWQSRFPGGRGAVRELCQLILVAQGKWSALVERYYR